MLLTCCSDSVQGTQTCECSDECTLQGLTACLGENGFSDGIDRSLLLCLGPLFLCRLSPDLSLESGKRVPERHS